MEMKKYNSDSTPVLERFARDKRKRTTSTERVERRFGSRRDADDTPSQEHAPKRASYNPNFTADNRLVERPERSERPTHHGFERRRDDARSYASRGERRFGDAPRRREEGAPTRYADRTSDRAASRYADRTPADRPSRYAHRDDNTAAGAPEERSARPARRPYGEKPRFGGNRFGMSKPAGKFGKRTYGEGDATSARHRDERDDRSKRFGTERRYDDRPKSYPRYNPNTQTGEMRLNRFIAQSGLCSRREADNYIQAGLVSVNGVIVTELGTKVQPTDEVKFNDSRVEGEKKVYLVLNKPKGFVTSLEDPHADKTVMDLVKGACQERIYPVGRLDKNSLGLLLFTNDGDLTRQLTHPSYQKKKIYQVSLDKPLTRADMDRIAEGIVLEDGEIHADEIAYVGEEKTDVGIEIHSGRNRIVRRIFESLGYSVRKLDRVYYAGLTKKNLKRGEWRFLTKEEVIRLKNGQYE